VLYGVGEVTARVGNGREYTVTWTDDSQTTVSSQLMFGAFTPHHRLDVGDHVIAARDDHFALATISKIDKNDKVKVRFIDGVTRYVTLRYVALRRPIVSLFTSDEGGGGTCFCPCLFVCLSV